MSCAVVGSGESEGLVRWEWGKLKWEQEGGEQGRGREDRWRRWWDAMGMAGEVREGVTILEVARLFVRSGGRIRRGGESAEGRSADLRAGRGNLNESPQFGVQLLSVPKSS